MRLHHVGIRVSDIGRSRRFYSETLGLTLLRTTEISLEISERLFGESIVARMDVFQVEGGVIELFYLVGASRVESSDPGLGINHFALEVDDRVQFCEHAERRGVPVLRLKRDGHFVYFIKDPDEVLIEIRDRPARWRSTRGRVSQD